MWIPCLLSPMKTILVIRNVHLSAFRVKFFSSSLSKTFMIKFLPFRACTTRSSAMLATPFKPAIDWVIICWYFSGAILMPNFYLLSLKIPSSVANAVMSLELLSNSIWWKTQRKSSWENTVLPFRLSYTSSTLVIGNLSHTIASLVLLMSTHKQMFPDGFGMTATGLTK